MVGSYCIHRVELDIETDDTLEHAGGARKKHKYIARVENKHPKSPKDKWRYFYSQEDYQAYLNREAKPGDRVQLPSGKMGIVGRDIAAPATRNRYRPQEDRDMPRAKTPDHTKTTARPTKVEKGAGLISRLFGDPDVNSDPSANTRSKGSSVVTDILQKLAEHRARMNGGNPPKSDGGDSSAGSFLEAAKAKAAEQKKAVEEKRQAAAEENAKKKAARDAKAKASSATSTTKSTDDKKGAKGSGRSSGGSGKGAGKSASKSGGSSAKQKAEDATSLKDVSKLPKVKGDHTPDSDMREAGSSDHDSSNCMAYELRRRGYEVSPSDANAGDIKSLASMFEGARVAEENNYGRLVAKLSRLPSGSRGIMQFGNRSVVWSVEKQGLVFRDCTNGKLLSDSFMQSKAPFKMIRTDNCKPKSNALRAVRTRR